MKLFILHSRLSGYMATCWRELVQSHNAEIMACIWPNQVDAPFDADAFSGIGTLHDRRQETAESLLQKIEAFKPDAILTSGWMDKEYVNVCRSIKGGGIPIIAGCDTQWKGSLRQHVASFIAPYHTQKLFDVMWVSGERQRQLAQKLGFVGHTCWDGYYACDYGSFFDAGNKVEANERSGFLTVGRLVPAKGLDTLAGAYAKYKTLVKDPWSLNVAGGGSESEALESAGATMMGFVQPVELPKMMAKSKCFILPSRFEPWGVVAQEAAASGLPLILSDACGASVHLLRDRWNGRSFDSGNVDELVAAMIWMHRQAVNDYAQMSERSKHLSSQYTPRRWANTLVGGLDI
jgi:glycosyltransferase involved in cell wall biosynthesis